jgi:hypothetical protein
MTRRTIFGRLSGEDCQGTISDVVFYEEGKQAIKTVFINYEELWMG